MGIYWNSHHHLLQAVHRVHGSILWANLHLLLWLSLLPVATAWMDENHYPSAPTALYGVELLMAAVDYSILQYLIIKSAGVDSSAKRAEGSAWKRKLSPLAYDSAIAVEPWSSLLSQALFIGAALVLGPSSRRHTPAHRLSSSRPRPDSLGRRCVIVYPFKRSLTLARILGAVS